ncbi:hypothetical protein QFC19_005511 [Naganishia cerealis]|uniref:Uncharacterized protein n=1 Tax=Naganishia cerealis TaxID=610337 RepID=A0ACC2VQI1_9TREE|nr:hypothetical protein QFC19_005511 [Naganishia cerealis]
MATRPGNTPLPRRVSFQDTCAVIPQLELNKPRLCTRTYSLCLSRRPSGDLLYDETFIPNQPTTLTLHLPTFTRAPPLYTGKRSRRSSTGGTPGFFGYKGDDQCGLKSCLHKSAHDATEGDIHAKKLVTPRGIHPTPPIVHSHPDACASFTKVLPHISSPIRRNSNSQQGTLSSPLQTPRSPASSTSSSFGIGKMSSFVTRPFLRRARSSTSSVAGNETSTASDSGSPLSRSRSYSTSASSAADPSASYGRARSQSFGSPTESEEDPKRKMEFRPLLREAVRHPGCIEEDVIEEEEVVEDAEDEQECNHSPQREPYATEPEELPGSSSVLLIHDCCKACVRNTLLGMKEDYVPPFSESAMRKIQRDREEEEKNKRIEKDVADVAAAAVGAGCEGSKRIWNGNSWIPETDLPSSERLHTSRHPGTNNEAEEADSDNESETRSGSSSRRGSGFDVDKAKSMVVDEVEYVRRMRRASIDSNSEHAGMENADHRGSNEEQKGNGKCIVTKVSHAFGDIPSPDHGIWITAKPTSRLCSPVKSSAQVETDIDYLRSKPRHSSPSRSTNSLNPSGPIEKGVETSHGIKSEDPAVAEHLVRQALQQEAEATKKSLAMANPEKDSYVKEEVSSRGEHKRRKWYKIPLPSPLAV